MRIIYRMRGKNHLLVSLSPEVTMLLVSNHSRDPVVVWEADPALVAAIRFSTRVRKPLSLAHYQTKTRLDHRKHMSVGNVLISSP